MLSLRPTTRLSRLASSLPVALGLASLLALGGCSLFKKKSPTVAFQERPVELLYSTGAHNLDMRQWKDAINYFHEVERQHPYSEWARRSMLMTAYADYEMDNYPEAINDANQFIALYPGNAATPYAFYLRAVCYFEQIVDVNRDQASALQAEVALRDVLRLYPQSAYSEDARLKLDMVEDQLAGKEMTIGRYYLRNNDAIAALGRFQTVIDKYQTTTHAPEALYRLVEADLTLGLLDDARRNASVLGYNYPGSYWYKQAYMLMTSRGMRPSLTPGTTTLPRLPFTKRQVSADIAPPPVEELASSEGTQPAAAMPAPVAKPTKAKPKKRDFLHGILGL
ncbi:MAG: outer membrane protein assembly factor BamD [Alphaproteobacteria bacterium]|nr:outer membrane protein assembly factor BamD [Alphaproteobacteria bacterium]